MDPWTLNVPEAVLRHSVKLFGSIHSGLENVDERLYCKKKAKQFVSIFSDTSLLGAITFLICKIYL